MTFKEQFCEEIEEAQELGRKAGLKEGERNAKLETARNLLIMGLSEEQIAQATGLTEEEIHALQRLLLCEFYRWQNCDFVRPATLMLANNMTVSDIAKYTGLTEADILALKM